MNNENTNNESREIWVFPTLDGQRYTYDGNASPAQPRDAKSRLKVIAWTADLLACKGPVCTTLTLQDSSGRVYTNIPCVIGCTTITLAESVSVPGHAELHLIEADCQSILAQLLDPLTQLVGQMTQAFGHLALAVGDNDLRLEPVKTGSATLWMFDKDDAQKMEVR